MIFGDVPVDQAEGAILAHGVPAATLSKGVVLGSGHVMALQALGFGSVTVARLEDGDIDEDTAAAALARALVPDPEAQGVRLTAPKAGRANVMAMRSGLLELDRARITALNGIDPMMTVSTLPDLQRVTAGVMLATIKVISYAVPQGTLTRACAELGGPAPYPLGIRTAHLKTATLIETHHPGQRPQPKARRVLEERLDRLGANLTQVVDVPHDTQAIANAVANADGEMICILTASATSDAYDTAPEALRRAGGKVIRFGVPVDPGTLMFLGDYTDDHGVRRPVIGLPGCARSPALNGADWVLERVVCGLALADDDISAMGLGGLLQDTADRGLSR